MKKNIYQNKISKNNKQKSYNFNYFVSSFIKDIKKNSLLN